MDKKQQRKNTPIYRGVIKYFPDAMAEVAKVSFIANEQHNKGEPMHWAKDKSKDEYDAMMRHLADVANGEEIDDDGLLHRGKIAWRALAGLQRYLEGSDIIE
jgi:hypothetical protein